MKPDVTAFYHEPTSTFSYVVSDPGTADAMIIDPVLDFDASAGRTDTKFADLLLDHVREAGLNVLWIIETHAHADHLTAAGYLSIALDAPIAIGEDIVRVQKTFKDIFNLDDRFDTDGSQFDHLIGDQECFDLGNLRVQAIATPGHTSDSVTIVVGDAAFVGDTLFMPNAGTARADFPGGDARTLYRSIRKILALPDGTRIFVCHDYPPADRDPQCETSVAEQKAANIHVNDSVTEDEFVAMRNARDRNLAMPRLIIPSIQVNIRAGQLPDAEGNGVSYLKTPVNVMGHAATA